MPHAAATMLTLCDLHVSFLPLSPDLGEGILDPFPLLVQGKVPATPRGSFRRVNPLLLVTERKGASSSLHYGAFPLDAFHTDGEITVGTFRRGEHFGP